mgnify:CR=1 FL=1
MTKLSTSALAAVSALAIMAGAAYANIAAGDKLGTTESEIRAALEGQGYTVEAFEVEDDEIEVELTMGGETFEAEIDPTTGEVLDDFALPLFASAFLAGLLARWVVVRSGASRVMEPQTLKALSGAASDVLIVCGIVSIEPATKRPCRRATSRCWYPRMAASSPSNWSRTS